MTDNLRLDLMVIILEEAFSMHEHYARKILTAGPTDNRFRKADQEAIDDADNIVQRIEARCSKIEG